MPTYDYKCKECGKVIEGETLAGSGYGKTESPQLSLGQGGGMVRGICRGFGRGPRDGRGRGRV